MRSLRQLRCALAMLSLAVAHAHAGASASNLQIEAVGDAPTTTPPCAQPPCATVTAGAGWVQLRNAHTWAPADLSRASLRLIRRVDVDAMPADAAAPTPSRTGLRLVSELHFGEARERDPSACAAVLGDADGVAPSATVTLWAGARCGFAFVPFLPGDTLQLLDGAHQSLVHEYVVPHAEHRVRERVLAGDGSMGSARSADGEGASQYSVQSLASAFASFTVANAGGAPLPPTAAAASAAPGIVVAPRRSAEAGIGELRAAALSPPPAQPQAFSSAGADDASLQAAYLNSLAEWNAQQAALKSLAVRQAALLAQAQQNATAAAAAQYVEDIVAKNATAARDALAVQAALALQIQSIGPGHSTCETIVHKAIYIAGKFDPGGCDPPTLQPGTPPSYVKGTAGTWTAGRAAYFTPGFWTAAVEPQWQPGTKGVFTPGTKGSLVPGACTPPSFTKAEFVPAWVEKRDCPL